MLSCSGSDWNCLTSSKNKVQLGIEFTAKGLTLTPNTVAIGIVSVKGSNP